MCLSVADAVIEQGRVGLAAEVTLHKCKSS